MRKRKIVAWLVGAFTIVGTAYLLLLRASRCERVVATPSLSPDGQYAATSTLKACPVGFLASTDCSISVALSYKSPTLSSPEETAVFQAADSSTTPTLKWVNHRELVLTVNDIGSVQVAKHELGDVRISYAVPKPIWRVLESIDSDRQRGHQASHELYRSGKLSKEDLRASNEVEDAVAEERAAFRRWVIANATIEDPSR